MKNREWIRRPVVIGSVGVLSFVMGCNSGGTDTTESTQAAVKAANPACTSARDACKTNIQSIADAIETACKPIAMDCGRHGGGGGAGGGAGGAGGDCSAARVACEAAYLAAKPKLESAAKTCESSMHDACVVDLPDAGAPNGFADGGGPIDHDGGGRDDHRGAGGGRGEPQESAACESAEAACVQSLGSLRSMPPAACTSIETACAQQNGAAPSAACTTAIGDCHDAIQMAATSAHDVCGMSIATACGGHGG